MPKAKPAASCPVDNISSIFTARRDLLLATRQVGGGSGLSV